VEFELNELKRLTLITDLSGYVTVGPFSAGYTVGQFAGIGIADVVCVTYVIQKCTEPTYTSVGGEKFWTGIVTATVSDWIFLSDGGVEEGNVFSGYSERRASNTVKRRTRKPSINRMTPAFIGQALRLDPLMPVANERTPRMTKQISRPLICGGRRRQLLNTLTPFSSPGYWEKNGMTIQAISNIATPEMASPVVRMKNSSSLVLVVISSPEERIPDPMIMRIITEILICSGIPRMLLTQEAILRRVGVVFCSRKNSLLRSPTRKMTTWCTIKWHHLNQPLLRLTRVHVLLTGPALGVAELYPHQ
jgi:hypothetical protein